MNTVLIGAQWGDEGKGKMIDVLSEDADVVVRFQGGNNAGHTVWIGEQKYVLHLIPCGILRPGISCVLGNGMVVDPLALVDEIKMLHKMGIKTKGRLLLSETAHLVLPYHRCLDQLNEKRLGKSKIGTTIRGIGPAYGDKVSRMGLRVLDMMHPDVLHGRLKKRVSAVNASLRYYGEKPVKFAEIEKDLQRAARFLKPYITDTVLWLHKKLTSGKKPTILFEGAQGTFLDNDFGTYPYVTSSNTTAGGASTGTGVPPHSIEKCLGSVKAYTTRVGEGPFPTQDDEMARMLHGMGREFGATTGRARRCGWFDAVSVGYARKLNGIDELVVTNLDGLDSLAKIKICVGYKLNGKRIDYPPNDIELFGKCEPVYRTFPGWKTPIDGITRYRDLPSNAQKYLDALSKAVGAPITLVSVGARRDQTIKV